MTFPECLAPLCRAALDCLFPPKCMGCAEPLWGQGQGVLCASCHEELPWIGPDACRRCGEAPGRHAVLGESCERCRRESIEFTRATAVFRFVNAVPELVHNLKYGNARHLAKPMGLLMAERLQEAAFPSRFDCVVPVPLHRKRLKQRGYNQSDLLARPIAKALDLPLLPDLLRRAAYTEPQVNLTTEERRRRPHGSFACDRRCDGYNVLLVDDVLTTGSTVSACARVLREQGARRIYVVALAR